MNARRPPARTRWSLPAAEAALVLVALALAFAAAVGGFVVGRETAGKDDSAEVAATTGETETERETEAETETETEGGDEVDGAAVFAEAGCGGCHVFEPAGSTGTIGPALDGVDLSKDEIAEQVRNGGGGMPPFGDRLSDEEIDAVADFVESG